MFLLIVFFTISILFSFLCSIWEAALLSISPAYVETLKKESPWVGNKIADFKKNIDQPLAAILTLNTIAHTVGAIGVGSQASKIWADSAVNIFGFELSVEALVASLMTLAILIISEIIPKTIGATYWKSLSKFTVTSVQGIIWLLYPLVWVSQWITKLLKKDKNRSVLSRTDFSIMADIGAREGVIKQGEYKIFKNLMRFDSVRAVDVMTPRTVLVSADESTVIDDYYKEFPKLRFSRIPIYNGQVDEMSGYILKDAMLEAIINGNGSKTLASLKREFKVVHENEKIGKIFESLIEQREQIALVVDEYGGVAGIMTTEDIVETLLGLEIMDELDDTADMQKLAREQWNKRAKTMGLSPEA